MDIDITVYKQEFLELLRSCKRDGIDDVINDLEEWGFFDAPASAGHHLNVKGGLVLHSLNTCKAALKVWEGMKQLEPTLEREVPRDSVILASLLHDVCKTDIYQPTTKRKRNAMGVYEDVPGYNVSYKNFPMGHGEKSLVLLLCSGLELTDAEMLAIRWHMGMFDVGENGSTNRYSFFTASDKSALVSIVHAADFLSSKLKEKTTTY